MKQNLVIVGAGRTAKHVYEFVKTYELYNVIGFAVNERYKDRSEYLGKPLYALETLRSEIPQNEYLIFVAVMWNKLNSERRKIYEFLKAENYIFANLISPRSSVRGVLEGDNCWVHDFVVIQNDAVIKNNVFMMTGTLVGAETLVKDHCFFAAKSTVGGGCIIGEQCFVGMNSTVFDDTIIGDRCIMGACTAVKRNLPDNSIYKTSSKIEIKTYDSETIENKLMFDKNVR